MVAFAMVFPGQGSQKVGMLCKLAEKFNIVEMIFTEASFVLGYDLWNIVQYGPTEKLNKTCFTQPALLASSVAIWSIWKKNKFQTPNFMAGHSLGEYSALVCSGVLKFSDAIKLVALRGTLMQETVQAGKGAMYAIIGLDNYKIKYACEQVASQGQIVSIVNFNSPDQVVIGGYKEAVKRASIACKAAGAKYLFKLSVSIPSHCELMKPVAKKLENILENINFYVPKIKVVSNVDVRVKQDPIFIRHNLVRQLYSPIRWTETIEYILRQGIEMLLEIGPGNILTKLTKNIIGSNIFSLAVNDPDSLNTAIKKLEY